MKALLIADNPQAIDNISQILETAGYDVITYKWLLKALDNIEEISPHLIIVSAKDYPRHWKTLAQYAQTVFASYKPQVILYAEGGLDDEEKSKAQALKVRGIFESIDVCGLEKLREILTKEADIYAGKLLTDDGVPTVGNLIFDDEQDLPLTDSVFEDSTVTETAPEEDSVMTENMSAEKDSIMTETTPVEEDSTVTENVPAEKDSTVTENAPSEEQQEINSISCSFIFENPLTGKLVTGYACNFDGKTFSFDADIPDFIKDLSEGSEIENGSLKTAENIRCIRTIVKKNQGNLLLELA
ncbi:response regulator [uncultured Treponema sp.]|uniref:response regulator n=1 Tax=uncultured Treponema sp. TaxID=162155 RepID=UPI0015C0AC5F|nr:response regulator [uncultured Treponema sp.]